MKGICFIDGENTYTTLGICIIKGSYNNLVAFPPAKEPDDKNDWPEEDGIEIDLSSLTLNTYDLSLDFAFKDDLGFSGLIDVLSDMGYHEFYFPILGRTYRLRFSSQNSYTIYPGFQVVKITLANDFPRNSDYEYQEPANSIPMPKGYEIDNRDLSEYGVAVLKGSNAEILKSPSVKKNLLQNFKRQDGATYDGEIVKFQTKEVSLKCLMRAPDIETFWRNWETFLYDLTRLSAKVDSEGYEYSDTERVLYCDEWSESYPCYYKDCQTNNFMLRGGVWWEFTLKLVFTCFRIEDTEFLLSSEAGEFIITEDGEFYIDLN
jgi:hypothetical protein